MPALLIRMSTWPNASSARRAALSQASRLVTSQAKPRWPAPELVGRGLRRRLVEIQDRDPRAMGGEQPRRRQADAARTGSAGDHRRLAGQQHASLPLCCPRGIMLFRETGSTA